MKYAFCNELFGEMPEMEGLQLAAGIGYTGVEVAPFTLGRSVEEISYARRTSYRRLVEQSGMEVVGLNWLLAKTEGFHLTTDDRSVREKTADYLSQLVELCAELGGSIMVLGSPQQRNFQPPMTHSQALDNAAETISVVVSTLERSRVRLAIEPLGPQEGNFLNHASDARTLIDRIGSEHVRLHLDVKAMSTEGQPIENVIRDNADLMIHFHANDPNLLGPGMGQVDQRPIFQALNDVNYQGWVSVEVFDYSLGVKRILQESIDNMRRCDQLAKGC